MRSSPLTRGLCVWCCDFAAWRPRRPLGVRAPRPDRPAARQEGGWAAAAPSSRRRSGRGQGGLLGSPLALAAASLSNSLHPAQPRAGAAPRGAESAALGPCPGRAPGRVCLVSAGAAGKRDPFGTGRASGRATRGGRRRARAGGKKFPGGLAALARGPGRQVGRERPDSTLWRSARPTARPPARREVLGEGNLAVGSGWSPQGFSRSASDLGKPRDEGWGDRWYLGQRIWTGILLSDACSLRRVW